MTNLNIFTFSRWVFFFLKSIFNLILQVNYILNRSEYKRGKPSKFGITKLLDSNTYKAAYTLHDVSKFR